MYLFQMGSIEMELKFYSISSFGPPEFGYVKLNDDKDVDIWNFLNDSWAIDKGDIIKISLKDVKGSIKGFIMHNRLQRYINMMNIDEKGTLYPYIKCYGGTKLSLKINNNEIKAK